MHFTLLMSIKLPEDMEQLLNTCPVQDVCKYVKEKLILGGAKDISEISPQEVSKQDRLDYLIEVLAAEQLAPFQHDTKDPRYIEFIDVHDAVLEHYETGSTDCVRLADGRVVPDYHPEFCEKYVCICGDVFRKHYGQLHQPKRTKKAKQIKFLPKYPNKKLFPTIDSYARDYCGYVPGKGSGRYGFYANPRCQWDYYHIGGRWPFRFLVKDGCEISMTADYFHLAEKRAHTLAPEGYRWVTGARKCDIAWDVMKDFDREQETAQFHQYESAYQAGGLPEQFDSVLVAGRGISRRGNWLYKAGETLEEYLERLGISSKPLHCVDTFTYLDGDEWKTCDTLYSDYDEFLDKRNKWDRQIADFIEKLPEDAFLISVDCHLCCLG